MRKFFGLFSCWLLLSGSIGQAPPAAFPDVPAITATSVGKACIGMPVARLQEVYKGCTFKPTYLVEYGFDDFGDKPGGVLVAQGKQKLFVYFAGGGTRRVAGLLALHPAYCTGVGLHPGSTSGQLKARLPAVRVVQNVMVAGTQIAFADEAGRQSISYVFQNQPDVGVYVLADEPVKITLTTARISWIQVLAQP